jgi:GDP-L-fucose synthase|tara:strand:- start:344 stop:1273 length:930 start_codon:yes stop_codon:yes gene_type:complete
MKILVTGGTGMVGSTFNNLGSKHTFTLVGSKDYDLSQYASTVQMIDDHNPDAIIHLAARVGGVKGNSDFVADFYSQNTRMNVNILDASHRADVKKVLSLLSTCVYPDKITYPLTEDQIHNGSPHPSNFGYAYAKRMLDVQSRALRQQYGCNFICAIPNNLYGPRDNFDIETGHVIPAIIRKVWEAKLNNSQPTFWGEGTALREFTYSKDIAQILLFLLENYNEALPINVGLTNEYSIRDVVYMVCDYLGYKGDIQWDITKPTGQFRKPSNGKRLIALGWREESYTPLKTGIKETCDWFLDNYPNVRGVL